MKIAFLTPEFSHFQTGTSGGIGTSILHLAKGLTALGHEAVILVYGQPKDAFFEWDNIGIFQIKNRKLKGLSWYLTRKKIENLINKLYNENKIDIVEAPDWTGITSFIQPKRCPIVLRLHGSDTYFCHLDQRLVKRWNKFHEKRAFQKADAILSVSDFTGKLTNQLFHLERKYQVIPNGIPSQEFTENEGSTDSIILYFGALIRKKGLLELPFIFNEVVKHHPNAQLVLLGKDVADIKTQSSSTWALMQPLFSKEAFQNVTYKGAVPYSDVKNHLNQASVCIFPSFAEAFPVSWLEAMSMGKALVTSNIGWATEIIDEGQTGFMVDPTNHQVFAEKILLLLDNPSLRKEMGNNARIKVLHFFDIHPIAQQNADFYTNMVKR